MFRIVPARKCSFNLQMYGKFSTASSCVLRYDEALKFDEESGKCFEHGQLLQGFSSIHASANDKALDGLLDTYHDALNKCIVQKSLATGLKLHSLLVNRGHELNSFIGTSLIRLFSACGYLSQADQIFRKLHEPNVFAWGAIILAHAKHGLYENAIKLYETFWSSDFLPDGHVYVAALQACTHTASLTFGRLIHTQILENGLQTQAFVLNGITNMYSKCHSFDDASHAFHTSTKRDAITWNIMMEGCNQNGRFFKTLQLFEQMQAEGFLSDNMTHVSVLQASSCLESLQQGKIIHCLTIESGTDRDMFVGSTLIHMYCKCGRLDYALDVFNARSEVRDIVVWRAMLSGYASCGHFKESYELFCHMQQHEGLEIGKRTYASILCACSNAGTLQFGQLIHTYVVESGLKVDSDLGRTLIGLYTNCGRLDIASKVFMGLQSRDTATLTTLMLGYADQGHCAKVYELFCKMYYEGIKADEVVFSTVLKAAYIQGSPLDLIRVIHAFVQVDSLESDLYIRTLLVELYARFEMYEDANWAIYNSIKESFCTLGCFVDSAQLKLLNRKQEDVALNLLRLCSTPEDLEGAQLVHCFLVECDYKWRAQSIGSLISIYSSCGMLDDACSVFVASESDAIMVWSSMIAAYTHHERGDAAFELFYRMQQQGLQLDQNIYLGISKAFFTSAQLMHGRMMHTWIGTNKVGSDRALTAAFIAMYARCGNLSDAQRVFDELLFRDVMTWNALIAGYASRGYFQESFKLFQAMQKVGCKPDAITLISMLNSCSSVSLLQVGKLVHHFAHEDGYDLSVSVGNSLTNMYINCGSPDDAESILDWLPFRNRSTWGLIIAGHAENGYFERALLLLQKMQQAGCTPDNVTIVNALKACSSTGTLVTGMLLHSLILLGKLKLNIHLANTIITMYSKCGRLEDAMKVFHCLWFRDTTTWNAMIAGCAHNNNCEMAWQFFRGMQNEDVKPDAITFLSILSVCSQMGTVKDGLDQFHRMVQQHGIAPTVEHYNCVIDLLGRTGSLVKAEDLLCSLPFMNNYVGWISLLCHCKLHEGTGVGGRCIDYIAKDENLNAAGYLLMGQVLSRSKHGTEENNVERLRTGMNAWKVPGIAYIEVNKSLFTFSVQRVENFPSDCADEKLVQLKRQIKHRGYLPCF